MKKCNYININYNKHESLGNNIINKLEIENDNFNINFNIKSPKIIKIIYSF